MIPFARDPECPKCGATMLINHFVGKPIDGDPHLVVKCGQCLWADRMAPKDAAPPLADTIPAKATPPTFKIGDRVRIADPATADAAIGRWRHQHPDLLDDVTIDFPSTNAQKADDCSRFGTVKRLRAPGLYAVVADGRGGANHWPTDALTPVEDAEAFPLCHAYRAWLGGATAPDRAHAVAFDGFLGLHLGFHLGCDGAPADNATTERQLGWLVKAFQAVAAEVVKEAGCAPSS